MRSPDIAFAVTVLMLVAIPLYDAGGQEDRTQHEVNLVRLQKLGALVGKEASSLFPHRPQHGGGVQDGVGSFLRVAIGSSWRGGSDGITHIASLPGVRGVLFIRGDLTAEWLEPLEKVGQLEELFVYEDVMGPREMKMLKRLIALKVLRVTGARITDTELVNIVPLQKLEWLHLRRTAVTDAGLVDVAKLPCLAFLSLADTQVTDLGMSTLSVCKGLRCLDIQGTRVTQRGLTYLAAMTRLRGVNCEALKWDSKDEAVSMIESFVRADRVEWLRLNFTSIGRSECESLGKMRKLRYLFLRGTSITDSSLRHLGGLRNLRYLDLSDTQVSSEHIEMLKRQLPTARIVVNLAELRNKQGDDPPSLDDFYSKMLDADRGGSK